MAAATQSFPVSTSGSSFTRVQRPPFALIWCLLLTMAVASGVMLARANGEIAAPVFVAYGLGSTRTAAPLLDSPGEHAARIVDVPPNTVVRIGGRLADTAGAGDALWAVAEVDGARRVGFLRSEHVELHTGTVPLLQLGNVPHAALLAPGDGVWTVGRHGGAVAVGQHGILAPIASAPISSLAIDSVSNARVDIAWLPPTVVIWAPLFETAGSRHGVDPELVAIIALVESGGDPAAKSNAGALGLMQVMPGTAADIARWRGMVAIDTRTLFQPAVAADFGAWYLARQLAAFGIADDEDWRISVDRAAAAYNGGPGSVSRWLKGGRLPAEAERYRGYVSGMWAERHDAESPTLDRWLRAGGSRLVAAAESRQTELNLDEEHLTHLAGTNP